MPNSKLRFFNVLAVTWCMYFAFDVMLAAIEAALMGEHVVVHSSDGALGRAIVGLAFTALFALALWVEVGPPPSPTRSRPNVKLPRTRATDAT